MARSGMATPTLTIYVPSGYWVDNQRYKQFQGNVYETYNTAKIEVDNDCAGSLVWTDNTANPSNCA